MRARCYPILFPAANFVAWSISCEIRRGTTEIPGSFRINYRTGQWADFATGAKGGDIISWYAHARRFDQAEAARQIAERLGEPLYVASGTSGVRAVASSNISRTNMTEQTESVQDLYRWGEEGPPVQHSEIRRHFYPRDGIPKVKVKIKRKGEPKDTWVTWYRAFRDGTPIGWRDNKPDDYRAIPYITAALNPFDPELKDDEIFWTEGERDTDACNSHNLPAFTFGGAGDGLPGGIEQFLRDRHIVILADNDDAGRKHAEKKAERAYSAGATAIKIIHFSDLQEKDVADFFEKGGTAEQLIDHTDKVRLWEQSDGAPGQPSLEDGGEYRKRQMKSPAPLCRILKPSAGNKASRHQQFVAISPACRLC
jgi:putative DNA primase/helicase